MNSKKLLFSLCLLLISCICSAEKILIERGTNAAIKLTVISSGSDANWHKIAQIVKDDLSNSGLFEAFLARQNVTNAQYYLNGELQNDGTRFNAVFNLNSSNDNRTIFKGSVKGSNAQIRDMAHFISNQIFKRITGLEGDFASKILYVSKNGNNYVLNISDYDGARVQPLLRSVLPIVSPRFAPDGKQIAYVSFESGKPQIFIQNIKTREREVISSHPGLNGAPAFSPDGKKLALVLSKDGNPEIYVMNLASKQLRRITNHFAIDTEPVWAADNQTLYFTSDRSGKPQIYRQQIASNQAQRITFAGNYNANPKVSKDGTSLVTVYRADGYRNFQIGVHNLARRNLSVISKNELSDAPTISPNGSMIIYVAKQGAGEVLRLSSSNGRINKLLVQNAGDVREPSWSF